jgi:recombinational DNA repair ATPase RecF
MVRIARLRIQNFRGIPQELDISFRPRSGASAVSVLLFGDNGSGKSSLADALEFVLRTTLLRRIDPERPTKRHAQSFAVKTSPYVEAEYDDGTTIARGAPGPKRGRFGPGVRKVEEPEPTFRLAPIVLRRADILGFWSVPATQRKLVFFDYFRAPTLDNNQRLEAAKIADSIIDELAGLRAEQEEAIAELGVAVNRDPSTLPRVASQLRSFRGRVLERHYSVEQQTRKGTIRRLAPEVNRPFNRAHSFAVEIERRERSQRLNAQRAAGTQHNRVEAEVQSILAEAGSVVTESFTAISSASDFVTGVRLEGAPDSNELDVVLDLANGATAAPEAVLSEANLDLLALLVFCAISEAAADHGQSKVLVFDDVFQSVDAVYRERACRYLADRFRDWQLFITTHDRLWFTMLAETLRSIGMPFLPREIIRWSFDEGPVIRDALVEPDSSLFRAMEAGDAIATCATAGLLLEEIADRLSWTFGTSITRRRGDRYTLGDLWPGVAKVLRRTDAVAEVEAVADSIVLRNLIGAHFNEWARSISNAEAERFGEATMSLLDRTHCKKCGHWLLPAAPGVKRWSCRCGALLIAG